MPEKDTSVGNLDMLLGEIKARLDSVSRQLENLDKHITKNIDELDGRVTNLEKDQYKLKGIVLASVFIAGIILPAVLKKLGF